MIKLIRLLIIIHTIGRYRLDELLRKNVPVKFRVLLLAFHFYPKNNMPRGERLRFALENLGPVFVKFGQLLSTRPDMVPEDIAQELNHLQDNVTPFCKNDLRTIVETELKGPLDTFFTSFSDEVLGSASVAQVHSAKLKNGDDVVVKVIRPNIHKIIAKDIQILLVIAKLVEKLTIDGRRLKPVEVVEDYRSTIFDELDLQLEASNASQLKRNFEGSSKLYIPKVYWDYTTQNVMVMERIDGIAVTDINALNAQKTDLKVLAERGVEIFFTQVFEHNFFHADMHPGNVFVSKTTPELPSYIAIDMAIVGSLTREDQYYLARNLLAMFKRDYRQVAELHIKSGWVPPETSLSGFESAIRKVCEPIFEKPIGEISFGESLISLFKTARRFNMPVQPQLVLLQKTLLNIEGLGRQLYPELNLWDTAFPFLEKWIKNRYHPKALYKDFKYNSAEWLEKFPELPKLLFNSIESVNSVADAIPELREASLAITEQKRNHRYRMFKKLSALAAALAGVISIYPSIGTLPITATCLFAASFLLLLL